MYVNRSLVFWGLGLVTAGIAALAVMQGYVDRSALADIWRLWPLMLVVIGIAVITGRTPFALAGTALAAIVIGGIVGAGIAIGPGLAFSCGSPNLPATTTEHSGTFGEHATLDWNLSCASTEVTTTSGAGSWDVRYGTDGGQQPSLDAGSDHLNLRSSNGGGFLGTDRERWVVRLPSPTEYEAAIVANGGSLDMNLAHSSFAGFTLEANAADVRLDFTEASTTSAYPGLDIHLNAGKLVIIAADSGGSVQGNIEANAASVMLCAPDNAPIRVTASGAAFGTNLDDTDLTRSGDTWQSATYASAHPDQAITLTVHGNAASFDLNPENECP